MRKPRKAFSTNTVTNPYVDTDLLIRLLTGDDPVKQADVTRLLERVHRGEVQLVAPVTVIADAFYVLRSRLYAFDRAQAADALLALVRLSGLLVENRSTIARALEILRDHNVDFGDAYIVTSMEHARATEVYSYNHDFDRIAGIRRLEPS